MSQRTCCQSVIETIVLLNEYPTPPVALEKLVGGSWKIDDNKIPGLDYIPNKALKMVVRIR